MSNKPFDGVEVTIGTEARHSIIWLHGLGADGNDFVPVVPELEKLGLSNCRFIFPHAPVQPVTINGGMKMRAWYDITSLDFDQRAEDGIRDAQESRGLGDVYKRQSHYSYHPDRLDRGRARRHHWR